MSNFEAGLCDYEIIHELIESNFKGDFYKLINIEVYYTTIRFKRSIKFNNQQ